MAANLVSARAGCLVLLTAVSMDDNLVDWMVGPTVVPKAVWKAVISAVNWAWRSAVSLDTLLAESRGMKMADEKACCWVEPMDEHWAGSTVCRRAAYLVGWWVLMTGDWKAVQKDESMAVATDDLRAGLWAESLVALWVSHWVVRKA